MLVNRDKAQRFLPAEQHPAVDKKIGAVRVG